MNEQEYILCAAIKRLTPRNCKSPYQNNDILNIEVGFRHIDILFRFKNEVSKNPLDQGFLTSKGRFVNRNEAKTIALKAKQIENSEFSSLFTEDLY